MHATARLGEIDLGMHALVGGLAVMCRLTVVHRVTQDVDTVTDSPSPSAVEVITSSIGTPDPANPNRAFIEGVRIDLIDTQAFGADELDGVNANDRIFVISHRWGLETATPVDIVAGRERATIRVATPAA